jgi:hypothetical protein
LHCHPRIHVTGATAEGTRQLRPWKESGARECGTQWHNVAIARRFENVEHQLADFDSGAPGRWPVSLRCGSPAPAITDVVTRARPRFDQIFRLEHLIRAHRGCRTNAILTHDVAHGRQAIADLQRAVCDQRCKFICKVAVTSQPRTRRAAVMGRAARLDRSASR